MLAWIVFLCIAQMEDMHAPVLRRDIAKSKEARGQEGTKKVQPILERVLSAMPQVGVAVVLFEREMQVVLEEIWAQLVTMLLSTKCLGRLDFAFLLFFEFLLMMGLVDPYQDIMERILWCFFCVVLVRRDRVRGRGIIAVVFMVKTMMMSGGRGREMVTVVSTIGLLSELLLMLELM